MRGQLELMKIIFDLFYNQQEYEKAHKKYLSNSEHLELMRDLHIFNYYVVKKKAKAKGFVDFDSEFECVIEGGFLTKLSANYIENYLRDSHNKSLPVSVINSKYYSTSCCAERLLSEVDSLEEAFW